MPRGWYIAQGPIPLTESSSDEEEGPCELPNGRLVCGPHGFVTCGKCCVDYTFMDDVLSRGSEYEDEYEDMDEEEEEDDSNSLDSGASRSNILSYSGPGLELRRGTGQSFPAKFVPSSASATPLELFSGRKAHILVKRYTLRNDTGTVLIRTDGACLNNGQPNPRAGWGFWHGLGPSGEQLVASGRLEKKGPFGDDGIQSSNRAELRAVIAALRFRFWPGEGFHTCVIATDSEYAVEGSTKWDTTWIQNGWMTRAGPIKNRDLWEALLGEVDRYNDKGMAVQFWRIPREWNMVADAAAKDAAAKEDAPDGWRDVAGINI